MEHELISKCSYTEMVRIDEVMPHPKNPNRHSKEQIERLAEIIKYQGFRHPIIVSKLSGFIVAGHGRLAAAMKLDLKEVPVDYQEFDSEDSEYAFLVSDNAIADWADLDFSMINSHIPDFSPDFNIDLLGIKDFKIDVNFDPGTESDQGKLDEKQPLDVQCPNCAEVFNAHDHNAK